MEKGVNLGSVAAVRGFGRKICKSAGFSIVSEHHHKFKGPNGITYCFILSESHFVIHTWPEEKKVFFDVFCCHKKVGRKQMLRILLDNFKGVVKKVSGLRYS